MPGAAAVLDALGHPTRRSIIEVLSAGSLPVGVLADRLPISRPATSQHLRVLKDAGLVVETVAGTRHEYRLDTTGIEAVRAYLDQFWGEALDRFAALAEREATTAGLAPSTRSDALANGTTRLRPDEGEPR